MKNIFGILLLGFLSACATPMAREQFRNDLLEAAFRHHVLPNAERDGAVFLSVYGSNDEEIDPPEDVMMRLSDLPFPVRPASKARRLKEILLRDIVDPQTGKYAVIFKVRIEKINNKKAKVWFYRDYGSLNADGYETEAVFENGKWNFIDTGRGSVS